MKVSRLGSSRLVGGGRGVPVVNQLIDAIRDAWSFAEHYVATSAYVLFEKVKRIPNVNGHFLEHVIR